MKDNTTPIKATMYDQSIEQTIPYYSAFHEQIIDVVRAWLWERKDERLSWLDTGCGTGSLAVLADRYFSGMTWTFLDPSYKMLEICREKTSNLKAEYKQESSQQITAVNAYDIVTAIQSHHYMHEEERKEATKRIFKALKPGGIYITFENCAPDGERLTQLELKRWGRYQAARGKTKEEVEAHLARYNISYFPITMEAHLKLLKEAGFNEIQVFWKSYMQIGIFAIKSV